MAKPSISVFYPILQLGSGLAANNRKSPNNSGLKRQVFLSGEADVEVGYLGLISGATGCLGPMFFFLSHSSAIPEVCPSSSWHKIAA